MPNTISLQPGEGMNYNVHKPLPYPSHVDADTGDVRPGPQTGNTAWRLIMNTTSMTAAAVAACILLAPAPALADTTPDYCPDPPSACATITPPGSAEPFPGDAPVDDAEHMTGSAEPFPGDAPAATPEAPSPTKDPSPTKAPSPTKGAPRPGLPKAGV